jgi:penicillin amidase
MYTMDRAGNIGYVHAGRYPQRVPGHDPRLPVPGDGRYDWIGLRPYSDNPAVRNPEQGYIANWNNRPRADWISTDLWTYTWSRADRARILFDAIEARRGAGVADVKSVNKEISFADVSAPFLLPYLFDAFEDKVPGGVVADAVALMQSWTRQWLVDEHGNYGPANALMEGWVRRLLEAVLKDDVGEDQFHLYAATNYPYKPLGPSIPNPPGVKVVQRNLDCLASECQPDHDFFNGKDPGELIRQTFEAAVVSLAEAQGGDSSAWVIKAYPMQWKPYNFRGVPQASESRVAELPGYHNRGSENNLFVATGEGIEARDVIPPGQSGFVGASGGSPHLQDQLPLYAKFGYKAVPFTRQAVKAAAVEVATLQLPD